MEKTEVVGAAAAAPLAPAAAKASASDSINGEAGFRRLVVQQQEDVPDLPRRRLSSTNECCTHVTVSGGSNYQANRMGDYGMIGYTGGKPMYQNSQGQYLYFWPAYGKWRISWDYTRETAGISIKSSSERCPVYAGTQGFIWTGEQWENWESGVVECANDEFTLSVRGDNGDELMKVVAGDVEQTMTLSTETTEYTFPTPVDGKFSVFLLNDRGPQNIHLESSVPTRVDFHRFAGWRCGSTDENARCQIVKNGLLAWGGEYKYTIIEADGCEAPEILSPPYSALKASHVHANDPIGTRHGQGRLDSPQAWTGARAVGTWWQIDAGMPKSIIGVVTQGRAGGRWANQRVTAYKVSVSLDENTWTSVDDGRTFEANVGISTTVNNTFASPVVARYVRIIVQSWISYPSMRSALLLDGCADSRPGQCVDGSSWYTENTLDKINLAQARFGECHDDISGIAGSLTTLNKASTGIELVAVGVAEIIDKVNRVYNKVLFDPPFIAELLGKIPKVGIFIKMGLKTVGKVLKAIDPLSELIAKWAKRVDSAIGLTSKTFTAMRVVSTGTDAYLRGSYYVMDALHQCGEAQGYSCASLAGGMEAYNQLNYATTSEQMETIAITGAICHDVLNPMDTFMRELAEVAAQIEELLAPIQEVIDAVAEFAAEMDAKIEEFKQMLADSDAAQCALEIFEPITDTINLLSCPIDEAYASIMHLVTNTLITKIETVLTQAYNEGLTTMVDFLVPDDLDIQIPDLTVSLPTAEWKTRFNAFCPQAGLAFPELETTLGAVANLDLPYRLTGADIENQILSEALAPLPEEVGDYESVCAEAWEEMGSDYEGCQSLLDQAADIAMQARCPVLTAAYNTAVGLVDVKQSEYDEAVRYVEAAQHAVNVALDNLRVAQKVLEQFGGLNFVPDHLVELVMGPIRKAQAIYALEQERQQNANDNVPIALHALNLAKRKMREERENMDFICNPTPYVVVEQGSCKSNGHNYIGTEEECRYAGEVVGVQSTNGGPLALNGEEYCEIGDMQRTECERSSCCQWNDGQCWSAIVQDTCTDMRSDDMDWQIAKSGTSGALCYASPSSAKHAGALFSGRSSSVADCKSKCTSNAQCKFFAHWQSTNWCQTNSVCNHWGSDGNHMITTYEHSQASEVPCMDGVQCAIGTRVETQWTIADGGDDAWYPGTVVNLNGENVAIRYDDGDSWVAPATLARVLPSQGLPVTWDAGRPGYYCYGNWEQDWGLRTTKSLSDCQASCEASSACTSIVVGAFGGVSNNCVLCSSTQLKSVSVSAWATTYTISEQSAAGNRQKWCGTSGGLAHLHFNTQTSGKLNGYDILQTATEESFQICKRRGNFHNEFGRRLEVVEPKPTLAMRLEGF